MSWNVGQAIAQESRINSGVNLFPLVDDAQRLENSPTSLQPANNENRSNIQRSALRPNVPGAFVFHWQRHYKHFIMTIDVPI